MAVPVQASEPTGGWEAPLEWLRSLPPEHVLERSDLDKWLEQNQSLLSQELKVTPRTEIFARCEAELKAMRILRQNDEPSASQAATTRVYRNKSRRNGKPITEKWRPVYVWLEALNQREVVKATEITEWLEAHLEVRQKLRLSHTNEHIFNYIQKCHSRMIADPRRRSHNVKFEKEKLQKEKQVAPVTFPEVRLKRSHKKMVAAEPNNVSAQSSIVKRIRKRKRWGVFKNEASGSTGVRPTRAELVAANNRGIDDRGKQAVSELPGSQASDLMDEYFSMDQNEAHRRFELLAALHKELVHLLGNFKEVPKERTLVKLDIPEASTRLGPATIARTRGRDPMKDSAWANSEAISGRKDEGRMNLGWLNTTMHSEGPDKPATSIFRCLVEREMGGNAGTVAFLPKDIGSHGRRWTSYVSGWNSLNNQYKGPISYLQKKAYSSWSASWCAYTSSVAQAPLGGVDGVQKVLDLRLHPGGKPQLVCSCNAAPNELLLYNLLNGRAKELAGHNCQIQAVEYALDGERIISCGTNILKVWDSETGTCLHTMGPIENEGTSGHKKKISAMAVHQLQSSGLVATSGGEGESEILLWNVRTGELASDLNAEIRQRSVQKLPSMDALKFCHQNLLICGSDSAGSQPAVVQIWDVDAVKDLMTFPASDSYITCLNTDPQGSTIITGAGDGSVGLFDVRTGGAISRLPLGSKIEATSVAFSSCGTYFHSSSTANHTLVWDTRMMPMSPGLMPRERPIAVSKQFSLSNKPLHCLSHGNPMPTTQNAGQLPGFVDEGDGGVNDARWCQSAPILVTASGNGSIAIWDVSLGQPCLRLLSSHSRCINTVVVSSNDQLICSGGDDQKVVLYHSSNAEFARGWRLTHPLSEELQPAARSEQS